MMTTPTLAFTALTIWAQTPDGTNALFAIIAGCGVAGANPRLCALLTVTLHIALIFL